MRFWFAAWCWIVVTSIAFASLNLLFASQFQTDSYSRASPVFDVFVAGHVDELVGEKPTGYLKTWDVTVFEFTEDRLTDDSLASSNDVLNTALPPRAPRTWNFETRFDMCTTFRTYQGTEKPWTVESGALAARGYFPALPDDTLSYETCDLDTSTKEWRVSFKVGSFGDTPGFLRFLVSSDGGRSWLPLLEERVDSTWSPRELQLSPRRTARFRLETVVQGVGSDVRVRDLRVGPPSPSPPPPPTSPPAPPSPPPSPPPTRRGCFQQFSDTMTFDREVTATHVTADKLVLVSGDQVRLFSLQNQKWAPVRNIDAAGARAVKTNDEGTVVVVSRPLYLTVSVYDWNGTLVADLVPPANELSYADSQESLDIAGDWPEIRVVTCSQKFTAASYTGSVVVSSVDRTGRVAEIHAEHGLTMRAPDDLVTKGLSNNVRVAFAGSDRLLIGHWQNGEVRLIDLSALPAQTVR